jgi:hypothetical protein
LRFAASNDVNDTASAVTTLLANCCSPRLEQCNVLEQQQQQQQAIGVGH